jgi:hypothetical protein
LQLFHNLRDGMPIEEALRQAYGFGVDELDDRWRATVGAAARHEQAAEPSATLTPTAVPTLQPIEPLPIAQAFEVPTSFSTPVTPSETNSPSKPISPETPTATIIGFVTLALLILVTITRRKKTS